ncbi:hypothetical protein [Pelagibaculum spongiae]|uniref:hypothetical protein n=1 Tax=Pelagibaculum spongiae TaxID=2080658 RepID=UPI001057ECB1|nr:hypothetical protein [Pelagibaculum spongiae]
MRTRNSVLTGIMFTLVSAVATSAEKAELVIQRSADDIERVTSQWFEQKGDIFQPVAAFSPKAKFYFDQQIVPLEIKKNGMIRLTMADLLKDKDKAFSAMPGSLSGDHIRLKSSLSFTQQTTTAPTVTPFVQPDLLATDQTSSEDATIIAPVSQNKPANVLSSITSLGKHYAVFIKYPALQFADKNRKLVSNWRDIRMTVPKKLIPQLRDPANITARMVVSFCPTLQHCAGSWQQSRDLNVASAKRHIDQYYGLRAKLHQIVLFNKRTGEILAQLEAKN